MDLRPPRRRTRSPGHCSRILRPNVRRHHAQVSSLADLVALPAHTKDIFIYRKNGGIGDVIMMTPAIRAVWHKFPGCRITVGVNPTYYENALSEVLRYNPYIHVVVPWQIGGRKFAATADCTHSAVKEELAGKVVSRIDMFARTCGVAVSDPIPIFVVDEHEDSIAKSWMKSHGIPPTAKLVVVTTRSNNVKKDWPEERFKKVCDRLIAWNKDVHVIVVHIDRRYEWKGNGRIHNMCGHSIRDVGAVIRRSELVLTPDTGILHIAAALRRKCVSIFGSTHPGAVCKHYPLVSYVWKPDVCSSAPCWYAKNPPCPGGNFKACITAVTVNDVLEKCKRAINSPPVEMVKMRKDYKPISRTIVSTVSTTDNVTIVIPTMDNTSYLTRCVDSIFGSTNYRNFDVVIVNNGNTVLPKFDGPVKVVNAGTNLGFGKACNLGASKTNSKYILFLNDDTEVTSGWLTTMVSAMEISQKHAVVGCKLIYGDKSIQHGGCRYNPRAKFFEHIGRGKMSDDPLVCRTVEMDVVTGACMLVRRSAFTKAGGFDDVWSPCYFEDSDLCLRLIRAGYTNVYCGAAEVYHHESRTSRRIDPRMKSFKKNHPVFIHRWHDFLVNRSGEGKEIAMHIVNNSGPTFSIILTSFNRTTYLADAIESILRQTVSDWELIIADDNSCKETKDIIDRYVSRVPSDKIRVISSNISDAMRTSDVRYSVMINSAMTIARGNIICYLTDDAIYFSRKLEVLEKIYKRDGVNAVYNAQRRSFIMDNGNEVGSKQEIRATCGVVTFPATLIDHNSFSHTRKISEGLVWETDPRYWSCADGIFQTQIAMRTMIVPIPHVLDEHKYHPMNAAWSYNGATAYKKATASRIQQGPPVRRMMPLAELEAKLWIKQ